MSALEQALTAPDSPELTNAVLNLAEFMEHCEKGTLPIPVSLLGDRAISCRAYAKALYYKVFFSSLCFLSGPSVIDRFSPPASSQNYSMELDTS